MITQSFSTTWNTQAICSTIKIWEKKYYCTATATVVLLHRDIKELTSSRLRPRNQEEAAADGHERQTGRRRWGRTILRPRNQEAAGQGGSRGQSDEKWRRHSGEQEVAGQGGSRGRRDEKQRRRRTERSASEARRDGKSAPENPAVLSEKMRSKAPSEKGSRWVRRGAAHQRRRSEEHEVARRKAAAAECAGTRNQLTTRRRSLEVLNPNCTWGLKCKLMHFVLLILEEN
jgi:hypothetical protein